MKLVSSEQNVQGCQNFLVQARDDLREKRKAKADVDAKLEKLKGVQGWVKTSKRWGREAREGAQRQI